MQTPQDPLSEAEERELRERLAEVGAPPLEFARGLFHGVVVAPSLLEPTKWIGLLLGDASEDATQIRRLFDLLMRDYNSCVECVGLGVPAVPAPEEEAAVRDFARGFVRVSQIDEHWGKDPAKLQGTVPFAYLAGYLDDESYEKAGGPEVPEEARTATLAGRLGEFIMNVQAEMAPLRATLSSKEAPGARSEKVGRNDPCPCGSGKKYKKCCLA